MSISNDWAVVLEKTLYDVLGQPLEEKSDRLIWAGKETVRGDKSRSFTYTREGEYKGRWQDWTTDEGGRNPFSFLLYWHGWDKEQAKDYLTQKGFISPNKKSDKAAVIRSDTYDWLHCESGAVYTQHIDRRSDGSKKTWFDPKFAKGHKVRDMLFAETLQCGSRTVVFVEGGKCARIAREANFDAFAIYNAGVMPSDVILQSVFKAGEYEYESVVLWADNDVPGEKCMDQIGQWLGKRGGIPITRINNSELWKEVRGQDIADILTVAKRVEIIENAEPWVYDEPDVPEPEIPVNYEPFGLGKWVAEMVKVKGLPYRFDTVSREWFEYTESHWREINWETVRANVSERYIEPLLLHAVYQLATCRSDDEKLWGANLSIIKKASPFSRTGFKDAMTYHLPVELKSPDPLLIPCKSGVFDIRKGRLVKFDPWKHYHKTVCPVYLDEADGGRRVIDVYCNAFMGRFQSKEMFRYCHSLLARALLGENDRVYMVWIGPAKCGKTTVARVIQSAFGFLALVVSENLFDPKGNHNSELWTFVIPN